jgi:class 3 adenylate cyclase/pimeloyl-ACP methyl ester carboxylesterase
MQCPQCQTENKAARRFCSACGAGLSASCPHCGFENSAGDQFCGGCGKALGSSAEPTVQHAPEPGTAEKLARSIPKDLAAKILATRGRIEGERRQVTVVFCDLAGSTTIAEELDPEVYRQLIDEYVAESFGCVHRYEGVVNQIAGDGFMAIFGAPIAHEDDAARACRAALDIMTGVHALSEKWADRLEQRVVARIGLNTGLVVVGTVGNDLRMDYTAIGDTTNVAARIQTFANPGEIYLSDATRKLVAHSFECENVGAETFKGKREQVSVFRLVREIPRRERRHQALRGGVSRFYGRRTELAILQDRYDEARSGRGQVVFVSGDAGIGKSRLIHEFRRTLDSSGYAWLDGQCVSYGNISTYLPFIDLLRGAFDIEESDAPEAIIDKVHGFCHAAGGLVARGEPFYRDLLSVDPGDRRLDGMMEAIKVSNYFEAFRDLLLATCREQPVIVLIEDIQWIDQSSEQLLRRLLDSIAGARIAVLITHRPGYVWAYGERSYFSRISLHGLPPSLVDELTESVLGRRDLPKALRRRIAERSDGNPFFVEELAKSLHELGLLECGAHQANLAVEVPSTVQEVIMARIDRLDDEAKHALQVASVIGREFGVRVLERVKDWTSSPSESLEKLCSLELIYEKTAHPEVSYMFKHALTHDVAYGTLLHAQRRELHRRIGALIEDIYAERLPEFYETLAYQYRQAEIPGSAARYALLSGERAASRFAPEADHYFRQAIDLSRGRAECRDIFIRSQAGYGDLLLVMGQIDAANEAYQEALRVATDTTSLQWLHNKLTHRYFLERDGVRLAYYIQGTAERDEDPVRRIPIVILHPLIQGSFQFQVLAQRLCQEYCVIYTDPRGIGASDRTNEPYDFGVRVQDAVATLRQLPYAKFILLGDSDGVRMAARIFHELPERVEKMVLFGGFARFGWAPDYPIGYTPEQIEQQFAEWVTPDYRTGLGAFMAMAADEPGLSATIEFIADNWVASCDQETFRQFVHNVWVEADDRHLFPGITVPTLVMAAEADRIVPLRFVRYLAEHIPGAAFALIKGSSHAAPSTAIDTFLEIVTTWVKTGSLPRTEWGT